MTSPRVLLVTKGLDIGGLERVVVDLSLGLSARDVPVEVAVVNPKRQQLRRQLTDAGVPVHDLGGGDRIGWAAWRRLVRLASEPRFNVVHVHGPLVAVATRTRRGGAPLVTTCHTPWTALHPLTRWAWRLTSRRDSATICVSAAVAESLPRRSRLAARVIPHGIDPVAIAKAARTDQDSEPPGAVVRAIVVASHRDAKNYPNLLRAVRVALDAGAPITLTAVGTGPGLPGHRELATKLGLNDVVSFREPSDDVLDLIAAADLLIVASDYEGQPIVVQEALALGRPVVGTAVGRIPELVTPDVGRVVGPRDPLALGAAIAELALDAELRSALADNALRQRQAWTIDDVVDAHLELYRELAQRHR